ncbi:MAG: HPP family protein [Chromatiaceae bacterium]|nr:HPP family protein [Candidatus Thioaporhodococcus sediminis]
MKGANAGEADHNRGSSSRWLNRYLAKMGGRASSGPSSVAWGEILWSWVGAFGGIGALSLLNQARVTATDNLLLIGSLGASAVLVFGAPRSPLAQPRNLVGGHLLSATIGVLCYVMVGDWPWLAAPLAVATAIALMHLSRTLHPPGGATALIAVAGSDQVHALGLTFVVMPVGVGVLVLLVVALLVNNLSPQRQYPEHWL